MPTRSFAMSAACAALLIAFQASGEATHVHPRASAASTARASAPTPAALVANGGQRARDAVTPPAPAMGSGYRRFTFDEPLADWRTVNDTVRAIGGWKAYAQEAARANAPASRRDASTPATAPAPKPVPAPASKEKP
jgi:hypothetical protein